MFEWVCVRACVRVCACVCIAVYLEQCLMRTIWYVRQRFCVCFMLEHLCVCMRRLVYVHVPCKIFKTNACEVAVKGGGIGNVA